MNSKQKIIYTKNCLEFLDYKCVTPNDKDFRIYEGKNSVIPSMVDANFNDDFLNNWNWIMEVVEAIEKLGFYSKISGCASSICHYCWFDEGGDGGDIPKNRTIIGYNGKNNESKKEAVVQAINQFLIWYNNEH